jgi:hypothetical protein
MTAVSSVSSCSCAAAMRPSMLSHTELGRYSLCGSAVSLSHESTLCLNSSWSSIHTEFEEDICGEQMSGLA